MEADGRKEDMNETAVVSIGRKVEGTPMGVLPWLTFAREVRSAVATHGTVVFEGFGHGVYDGVAEDSFTVIVADVHGRIALRKTLGGFAHRWGQDSIALTIGETVFCGAEGRVES